MEQEQEKIILENNFAELSLADKDVLSDLISSEEEFDVVKQILAMAPTLNDGVAPSPNLKASLMETFSTQHGGNAAIVGAAGSSNTKTIVLRSVAAVAAIFILFMFLFPFGNNKTETNLTAENKEKPVEQKEKTASQEEKTEDPNKENTFEQKSIDPIVESPVQVAVNNSPSVSERRESRSALVESDKISSSTAFFVDAAHSDRLLTRDLPAQSRQVVQDNPALLDVLYTAF